MKSAVLVMPYDTTLPAEPNYRATGQICGHPIAFEFRLPEEMPLEDKLWVGTRAVVRHFLQSGQGKRVSLNKALHEHRLIWRHI